MSRKILRWPRRRGRRDAAATGVSPGTRPGDRRPQLATRILCGLSRESAPEPPPPTPTHPLGHVTRPMTTATTTLTTTETTTPQGVGGGWRLGGSKKNPLIGLDVAIKPPKPHPPPPAHLPEIRGSSLFSSRVCPRYTASTAWKSVPERHRFQGSLQFALLEKPLAFH